MFEMKNTEYIEHCAVVELFECNLAVAHTSSLYFVQEDFGTETEF